MTEPISVKNARLKVKMKQKDVARSLNLSVSTYAKKENGKGRFFVDEILILSRLFGVEYDCFIESTCQKETYETQAIS